MLSLVRAGLYKRIMSSLASSVCAPVLLLALLSSVAVADEEVITGDVKSTNTWQACKFKQGRVKSCFLFVFFFSNQLDQNSSYIGY